MRMHSVKLQPNFQKGGGAFFQGEGVAIFT